MPDSTQNPLTQTTLDISTGEDPNKELFVFRIPSVREYAKMGARAHELRRMDSPSTGGGEYGMDGVTSDIYRGLALFETLLSRADAKDNWPFTTDATGKPVVDSDKFPPTATRSLIDAYRGFEAEYARFLAGGTREGVVAS